MFNDELNAVKKELTQKSQRMAPSHPKFSGQGLWARQLKRRIERGMMVGLTLSLLQTALGPSKTMNGRVHSNYSVLKGLTKVLKGVTLQFNFLC